MRKYFLPVVLFLASCCSPGERRVDIVVRNDFAWPVEVRASAGLFGQRLFLAPGEEWRGWIPLDFVGGEVRVSIQEDSRLRPTR